MKIPKNPNNTNRAGFTLIELLAVVMIIGILMMFLLPRIGTALDATKVTACKLNMTEIWKGMLAYDMKYDKIPKHSGVRFFGSLVRDEVFEVVESDARRLTCPGVKISFLEGPADLPMEEWFTRDNFDFVDGGYSAYAGRDLHNHPLKQFPTKNTEVLIADDNDGGMNHETTTVVLWGGAARCAPSETRAASAVAETTRVSAAAPAAAEVTTRLRGVIRSSATAALPLVSTGAATRALEALRPNGLIHIHPTF